MSADILQCIVSFVLVTLLLSFVLARSFDVYVAVVVPECGIIL